MLLLSIRLPELLLGLADPSDISPFVGRPPTAGPMLLFVIVFPLFAPPIEVLMRIVPPAVPTAVVEEPTIAQFVIVLFCAPLIRRIVLVPATAELFVFEKLSAFEPSMVTLSAPLRSINGLPSGIAPEMMCTTLGAISTDM